MAKKFYSLTPQGSKWFHPDFESLSEEQVKDSEVMMPPEKATKFDYDVRSKTWKRSQVTVQLAKGPFTRGFTRFVYRIRVLQQAGVSDSVAKVFDARTLIPLLGSITRQMYYDEAMALIVAGEYSQIFNKTKPPQAVSFVNTYILELVERPGRPLCAVEPVLEGDFIKHNNNEGGVFSSRMTPQAFSHFTYESSGHKLLVCDIQGTHNTWTDPQIHSVENKGFGLGNSGVAGMKKFLKSHTCGVVCAVAKLPRLSRGKRLADWSKEEVARLLADLQSGKSSGPSVQLVLSRTGSASSNSSGGGGGGGGGSSNGANDNDADNNRDVGQDLVSPYEPPSPITPAIRPAPAWEPTDFVNNGSAATNHAGSNGDSGSVQVLGSETSDRALENSNDISPIDSQDHVIAAAKAMTHRLRSELVQVTTERDEALSQVQQHGDSIARLEASMRDESHRHEMELNALRSAAVSGAGGGQFNDWERLRMLEMECKAARSKAESRDDEVDKLQSQLRRKEDENRVKIDDLEARLRSKEQALVSANQRIGEQDAEIAELRENLRATSVKSALDLEKERLQSKTELESAQSRISMLETRLRVLEATHQMPASPPIREQTSASAVTVSSDVMDSKLELDHDPVAATPSNVDGASKVDDMNRTPPQMSPRHWHGLQGQHQEQPATPTAGEGPAVSAEPSPYRAAYAPVHEPLSGSVLHEPPTGIVSEMGGAGDLEALRQEARRQAAEAQRLREQLETARSRRTAAAAAASAAAAAAASSSMNGSINDTVDGGDGDVSSVEPSPQKASSSGSKPTGLAADDWLLEQQKLLETERARREQARLVREETRQRRIAEEEARAAEMQRLEQDRVAREAEITRLEQERESTLAAREERSASIASSTSYDIGAGLRRTSDISDFDVQGQGASIASTSANHYGLQSPSATAPGQPSDGRGNLSVDDANAGGSSWRSEYWKSRLMNGARADGQSQPTSSSNVNVGQHSPPISATNSGGASVGQPSFRSERALFGRGSSQSQSHMEHGVSSYAPSGASSTSMYPSMSLLGRPLPEPLPSHTFSTTSSSAMQSQSQSSQKWQAMSQSHISTSSSSSFLHDANATGSASNSNHTGNGAHSMGGSSDQNSRYHLSQSTSGAMNSSGAQWWRQPQGGSQGAVPLFSSPTKQATAPTTGAGTSGASPGIEDEQLAIAGRGTYC